MCNGTNENNIKKMVEIKKTQIHVELLQFHVGICVFFELNLLLNYIIDNKHYLN